ncbi:MAG: hypothetical protein U0350_21330 [Caldilineaceae bacterium]
MYEELPAWRTAHPGASFDEIAGQVTVKRQALMSELLRTFAEQPGRRGFVAERMCPACGGVLHYKGEKPRTVFHAEGQPVLTRGYHHCNQCGHSFFPSGPDVAVRGAELDAGHGGRVSTGRGAFGGGDSCLATGG